MMKNIILTTMMFFCLFAKGQNNTMLSSEINISGVSFSEQTGASFINTFGIPDSIDYEYFNELDNETYIEYTYGQNHFYFENGDLINFSLKDSSFYFHNPSIRAGNNISCLIPYFPESYNLKDEGVSEPNRGFITIQLVLEDGSFQDAFISFYFDRQTNIILAINYGTP